jgi:hypothetical protein
MVDRQGEMIAWVQTYRRGTREFLSDLRRTSRNVKLLQRCQGAMCAAQRHQFPGLKGLFVFGASDVFQAVQNRVFRQLDAPRHVGNVDLEERIFVEIFPSLGKARFSVGGAHDTSPTNRDYHERYGKIYFEAKAAEIL